MLQTVNSLHQQFVLPILRENTAEAAWWCIEQLVAAQFQVIELTWTTPEASRILRDAARQWPHVCFGAGSVQQEVNAKAAIEAGAKFLVSPSGLNTWVTALTDEASARGVVLIPGALTPTEIEALAHSGTAMVKVFPIQAVGGASYLKAIMPPLKASEKQAKLLATGGIDLSEVSAYRDAGAWAVGLGRCLFPNVFVASRDAHALRTLWHEDLGWDVENGGFLDTSSTGVVAVQ